MVDPLAKTAEICLVFPEALQLPYGLAGEHADFKVRNKTFAAYMNNHHGDGRLAIWCKAAPGIQQLLVGDDPVRFFVPPYVGPRGWVGIRIDVGEVDWVQVTDIVTESYKLVAPKTLAKQVQ